MKKILYVDMDGVIADFDGAINTYINQLNINLNDWDNKHDLVDYICENNRKIFSNLEPISGSIDTVNKLFHLYDVYFLSTPMWNVPESFMDKRIWLEKHFDYLASKRLILTHRKDLNIGDYLIDDRIVNGVENFKGEHIHFGTEKFPDWYTTYEYLKEQK